MHSEPRRVCAVLEHILIGQSALSEGVKASGIVKKSETYSSGHTKQVYYTTSCVTTKRDGKTNRKEGKHRKTNSFSTPKGR